MGKMKEIEVISVGNEGFEPCVEVTELESIPVATLEEFINSPWIDHEESDTQQLEMKELESQFKFKVL